MSLSRSESLQRVAPRKAPTMDVPKGKKDYDIVKQGMKELYPRTDNFVPDIDIVFVPGLGADPEKSWKSSRTEFNWTSQSDGLVRDFPKARILLYMYESAWTGQLKVKQFLRNIAMGLLISLRSSREECKGRPIVFISHSMGGLVVAKAITIADSRRDLFPKMFEAIAASIFFGTPFGGAKVAAFAAMYSYVAEKMGKAVSSKLLELMKPGDEELYELRHELMRLARKLNPNIELFCFWEEQPTDFSKIVNLPGLFNLTKDLIPKKYSEFVTRESAQLPGVDDLGLACNHRDLVKFDSPKDDRWNQMVRDPLKRIIHGAQTAVKGRLNSTRNIDISFISGIMETLDGAQVYKKRKQLSITFAPSSWIPQETEYLEWLDSHKHISEDPPKRIGDCMWIKGPEGRGKTSATMAALVDIEEVIKIAEDAGQEPILLAYFFCDAVADYSSAEDLLKSLLRQLISQQQTLASYAKMFGKKKPKEDSKEPNKQMTVDNLWQVFQDMLYDDLIGRRLYIILNNIHVLPETSDSTIKLMNCINSEIRQMRNTSSKRMPVRWFITSREAPNEEMMRSQGVRIIDLENEKYENQVQLELRKHAKMKVADLGIGKKYNKALSYFASSLIGKRAQNTQWIDITCIKLEELDESGSDFNKVRRVLETMPRDLNSLLIDAWTSVFNSNKEEDMEKIKEILRTLVLTYEDPTVAELGVLSGLGSKASEKDELSQLILMCKPLLQLRRTSKTGTTVSFMNSVIKVHLLDNSKLLLGLSEEETKWQHGVISLRSFSHLIECFDFDEAPPKANEEVGTDIDDGVDNSPGVSNRHGGTETGQHEEENKENNEGKGNGDDTSNDSDSNNEDEDTSDEVDPSDVNSDGDVSSEGTDDWDESDYEWDESDDESEDRDPEADILKEKALAYVVKHWLNHASKATPEIAEDLSLEKDFWELSSRIRRRWLVEYDRMTDNLEEFYYRSFTSLHVVASVGYKQLMTALIRNGHEHEINAYDQLRNTPLHIASYFGHSQIVEELLRLKAPVNDGIERDDETPLHLAARSGHVEVMKKLLSRDANANAIATTGDGPVINSAIYSGNREAVKLLVNHGVSLAFDGDGTSPLAAAAILSDISMFDYLIEKYAEKLPAQEFSKALVEAANAGRLRVVQKLLKYQHSQSDFQDALDKAAEEWNWDIIPVLLKNCEGLDCANAFYKAATEAESEENILKEIWEYSKADLPPETLNDSLYVATDRENESTVRLLLQEFKVNPNATGKEYGNALTAAAYDGTIEIVRLLLKAGAKVNSPDGWALQTAAAEGHYEVVKELLIPEYGGYVNTMIDSKNFPAGTALQAACEASRSDIVELLLRQKGVDPNLGSGDEAPPIIAAAIRSETRILEMLVGAKANPNVFGGRYNSSPLIYAAMYMPVASIQLLLSAGADINLHDDDNDTPLIAAARRGDVDSVKVLLKNGADVLHSNKLEENALQAAMTNQHQDCLEEIVNKVSKLLRALKISVDSGNQSVANVIRSVTGNIQGLDYDDASGNSRRSHADDSTHHPSDDEVEHDPLGNIQHNPDDTSGHKLSEHEQPDYDQSGQESSEHDQDGSENDSEDL